MIELDRTKKHSLGGSFPTATHMLKNGEKRLPQSQAWQVAEAQKHRPGTQRDATRRDLRWAPLGSTFRGRASSLKRYQGPSTRQMGCCRLLYPRMPKVFPHVSRIFLG